MSSKSIDRKYHDTRNDFRDSFRLKNVIIPLSSIFTAKERYIYSGEEKIPFNKRHPVYRVLLLNEFRE